MTRASWNQRSSSITPLLAILVSAVGALLIAGTGERRANLREFWSVRSRSPAVRACGLDDPGVLAGRTPECVLFRLLPGIELAFRVDAFGLLFAARRVASLDRDLVLLDRLHAFARGARADSLLSPASPWPCPPPWAWPSPPTSSRCSCSMKRLTLATYPLVGAQGDGRGQGWRPQVHHLSSGRRQGVPHGGHHPDLQRGRNPRVPQRRNPAGFGAVRPSRRCSIVMFALFLFGFAKNAVMPLAQLAAGRHGGAHAGQRAPACRGRGQDRGLRHAPRLPVRFRRRGHAASRRRHLALGVASVTILVGSLLALGQDNLKARLAFSTISQLSYIVLGAALLTPSGILGGIAHITNHAVSKITLFLCAGSIYVSAHKTEVSQMSGLARQMPWTMAAFAVASLSLVGIPPASGFVSKWYLALGSVERGSRGCWACCCQLAAERGLPRPRRVQGVLRGGARPPGTITFARCPGWSSLWYSPRWPACCWACTRILS